MASDRTLARATLMPQTRESDESLTPVLTPELVYGPTWETRLGAKSHHKPE